MLDDEALDTFAPRSSEHHGQDGCVVGPGQQRVPGQAMDQEHGLGRPFLQVHGAIVSAVSVGAIWMMCINSPVQPVA